MQKLLFFVAVFFGVVNAFGQQPTSIAIDVELGSNPSCEGSLVQLKAVPSELNSAYQYDWWEIPQEGPENGRRNNVKRVLPDGSTQDVRGVEGPNGENTFIRINPRFTTLYGVRIGGTTKEITITVDKSPNPGLDSSIFLCGKTSDIDLFAELDGAPETGGTWSPGNGVYDITNTNGGVFTYTVDKGGACPIQSATVTVRPCGINDGDNDGILNDVDTDDDNDGIPDTVEDGFCTPASLTPTFILEEDFGFGGPTRSKFVDGTGLIYNPGIPQDINGNDGEYNIATSSYYLTLNQGPAVFIRTDLEMDTDADGDVNGRFMAINMKTSSFDNKPIFQVKDLPVIPGVEYDFSMAVVSLSNNTAEVEPHLQIEVIDQSNPTVPIFSQDSGEIPNGNDKWNNYGTKFTPAVGTTLVTIQVVNLQTAGGNGNDVGIDNIFLSRLQCDFDRDGIPNSEDLDSDNDGIYDIVENNEGAKDADGDGRVDNQADSGSITAIVNSDSDANPDYLDVDSDNDGIIDHVEAMETASYIGPSGADGNFNGVDDSYDTNGTPIVLADTDADGTPDYLDDNSDDDCLDDTVEAYDLDEDGVSDILNAAFNDTDNDGLDDDYDTEVLGRLTSDTNGTNGGQEPSVFPDVHNPGGDRDWRDEFIATPIVLTDVADVCQGATTVFNLFDELNTMLAALTPPISSLPTTGTWTVPVGGNAVTGGHLGTLDVSTVMSPALSYIYTLPRIGTCPERTFTMPVEVTPVPFAGEDATDSVCTSDPAFDLFSLLGDRMDGTMPSPGGEWTVGTTGVVFGTDDKGSFNPLTDTFGVYTYTVTGGSGCGTDEATVTISIGGANPGTPPASPQQYCRDDATTVDLFTLLTGTPQASGTWTLPDGTVFNGMLTPNDASFVSGDYTYEVVASGCPGATSIIEVVITDVPMLQVQNSDKVCNGVGVSATSYDITYTLTGTGTVTSDFGTVDETTSMVTGIPKDQDIVLTVTPAANTACFFELDVTAPNCDCPVVADPTSPSDETICEDDTIPALSVTVGAGLVANWFRADGTPIAAAQGTVAYTPSAADLVIGENIFRVEAADATGCPSNQVDVKLTLVGNPDIVLPTVTESCDEFVLAPLVVGDYFDAPVGTFSRMRLSAGDVLTSSQTLYIYAENTVGSQVCASQEMFDITVNPLPIPVAPTLDAAYCNSFSLPVLANPTTQQYFTSPAGGGSELMAGDAITSTQTIYIFETSAAGCTNEISFEVVIENITGNPGEDGSLDLCTNDAPIALITGLGGNPTDNGSWTLPDGSMQTDPNFEIDPAIAASGTYTYTINTTSTCSGVSGTVEVSILGIPAPTLPTTLPVGNQCESFTLPSLPANQFYSTISLATDPSSIGDLNVGEVLTSTTDLFLIEENANGCKGEIPFRISIENLPVFELTGGNGCVDDSGNIVPITISTPLSTVDYDLQWLLNGTILAGETNPTIDATTIGDYTIEYSSKTTTGCSDTQTTSILPIESPDNLTFNVSLNTVELFVTQGDNLTYTLIGIDTNYVVSQVGNVFRGVPPGDYVATVSNECNSLSIDVPVFGFPEFFSPNGDIDNEVWNVKGNPGDTKIIISIYDRYGRLLASFNPDGRGWNGTYNDIHMPADDYWYYAKTDDGEEFRGHFALLR